MSGQITPQLRQALAEAADAARHAPSIHNTQPWRWVVRPDRLELFPAGERQLRAVDPEARMLLLSCGAALHHAQLALDAQGWRYRVERPAAEPLAVIHAESHGESEPVAMRHFQMIGIRHTDRRTVADEPVPGDVLQVLIDAAARFGVRVHVLNRDQVIELAVIVEQAQKAEADDEERTAETAAWVGGGRPSGAGLPDSVIPVELPPTTVAERDFHAAGTLVAGAGHDNTATYAILYGAGDQSVDWLRAGEALSALWLTAIEQAVTVLPISNPVEVPFTRSALRHLLGELGFPYLVVRLGRGDPVHPGPEPTPRLGADQVIEFAD